jgi:hypothetical protein
MRVGIGLAACLALAGCTQAQIRMPTSLAAGAAPTEFIGIGGRPSGSFTAGPYSGRFDRGLERASFTDGTIERSGGSRFTIAGPEISSTIEADCRMREHALDLGVAELTTRPLAYGCSFTAEGRAIPARFELQEFFGSRSAIVRYERRGEIALGGELISFRSIHHTAGTSLPSLTPVGYQFEQRGRVIGALSLTGRPALTGDPHLDPGVLRTMTIAATALALFWDPAIHHLD